MSRIRYAIRSLAKSPLLALVVLLSLALGIGANTAIFSLLHQVVLASLPVEKPEQLVLITSPGDFKSGRSSTNDSGGGDYIFSYPIFRALEKSPGSLAGLAGFDNLGANLAYGNQTINGSAMVVSGSYFQVLGARPLMGRFLTPEDDRHGAGNPVAVLSYGYWKDKLGGEPGVLNQTIRVNARPLTIVGVAPRNFQGTTIGQNAEVYVPMALKAAMTPGWDGTTSNFNDYWIYLVGRLKPNVTREQAAASLNSTYSGLVAEQAKTAHFRNPKQLERFRESRLSVIDGSHGKSSVRDEGKTPILILQIATGLVLLIAMANAANLLLARSASRKRELAIRAAMGAGRGELMSQLLVEAMLLAFAGCLLGLLLGSLTLKVLVTQVSEAAGNEGFLTSQLETPVLLFALGLGLLTGLLFGLYPAWDAARAGLAGTLKDEGGQTSGTRAAVRVRKGLVCAQVTISAVLLIPTGLFLKSLVNLVHVDLGMKTGNLIGFSISPALNGYKPEQCRPLFERIESELAAIPGVRSVSASRVPLIGGSNWGNSVKIEGAPPGRDYDSRFNEVGPGYFSKLGIPLIAGREFTVADSGVSKVAVVNETFVKAFLDGRAPIGVRFSTDDKTPDIEIVGVVKDSHYSAVKQVPPKLFFVPWRQDKGINSIGFYVRTAIPPEQMVQQIRRVMSAIDRDLPLERLRTLDEQIRLNIQSDRLVLQLAAAFAVLATLLAMLGLYGVMAHSVTRRTREIGIRMALGAGPRRILGMVMRELGWILGIGMIVGIPAALAITKFTESQLYGVKPRDAMVVVLASAALVVTAVLAGYLPARRAARINPLNALRHE